MNSDLINTDIQRFHTKSIPVTFKGGLPTIEQIEVELGEERG
jgi:hypothetical protein